MCSNRWPKNGHSSVSLRQVHLHHFRRSQVHTVEIHCLDEIRLADYLLDEVAFSRVFQLQYPENPWRRGCSVSSVR